MQSQLRMTRTRLSPGRTTSALIASLALVTLGCSNGGDTTDSSVTTSAALTTSTTAPDVTEAPARPTFGDMPSPCGPAGPSGVPTVAEGQNGTSPLLLGTASDHGYEGAEGESIEMLDAAQAFAAWCNAQGGIRGLDIDIVDLDAKGANVPLAMEQTCAEVFAMVGGGWVFDDQMFPRFHECGMVSFPAFTASAAATMANGKVQPVPTPIDQESTVWLEWVKRTYPAAVDATAVVYADVMTIRALAQRTVAVMQLVEGFGDPEMIPYEPTTATNWANVLKQLEGTKAVAFIGDTAHLVDFYGAMQAADYTPDVVFGDTNLMNDVLLGNPARTGASTTSQNSTTGVEAMYANLRIRAIHTPLSDPPASPGMKSYVEMMSQFAPSGRLGSLGVHTTSAMLLFVTAANACLDANDNILERECILAQARTITAWTAGGLHAPTNPGASSPSVCLIVAGIEAGSWSQVFPESGESDTPGFECDEESIVTIEGDFGDVTTGLDSSRLN